MRFRKGRSQPGHGSAWKVRIARQIQRAAEKMGWLVDIEEARTGTLYLTCERDLPTGSWSPSIRGDGQIWTADTQEAKIRVADHAECYCSEDISVDPQGATWRQAVALLANAA